MHLTGRKAVFEIAPPDVGQDRLGGDDVDRVSGAVDSPRVRLQVLGHVERTGQGLRPDVPRPAFGKMIDQRQCGDELAILGKMSFKRGRQFVATQSPLEPAPPIQEPRRRRLVEAEERHLVICPLQSAQLEHLGLSELGDPLKDSPDCVSALRVGPLVDVLPVGGFVGPDQQSEPLDQSITARAVRIRAANVFGDLCRLRITQHPDANGLDMNMPAGDAVEGVGLREAPSKPSKPGFEGFEGAQSRDFSDFVGPYSRVIAALEARCPDLIPADRWQAAVGDGRAFLAKWGEQAEALGWTFRDLFGLHKPPEKPHPSYSRLSRYDETGLIWLLQRREVVALTEATAAIQNPTGAIIVFRKHNKPTLGPVGDSLDDLQ